MITTYNSKGDTPLDTPTLGRPWASTDLGDPLTRYLGHPVATIDGAHTGTLADVQLDGSATIVDHRDIVVAVVPTETVRPALSRVWSRRPVALDSGCWGTRGWGFHKAAA